MGSSCHNNISDVIYIKFLQGFKSASSRCHINPYRPTSDFSWDLSHNFLSCLVVSSISLKQTCLKNSRSLNNSKAPCLVLLPRHNRCDREEEQILTNQLINVQSIQRPRLRIFYQGQSHMSRRQSHQLQYQKSRLYYHCTRYNNASSVELSFHRITRSLVWQDLRVFCCFDYNIGYVFIDTKNLC